MIGPVLIVVLLVRAWTGHGHEIPCEPGTCQRAQLVAETQAPPVPVDMGARRDMAVTVARDAPQLAEVRAPK